MSYRHRYRMTPSRRRYVFYVRALSDAGASQPSRSASVDVPPEGTQVDIQAPAPPGDFTAVLTPNNDALAPVDGPDALAGSRSLHALRGLSRVAGQSSVRETRGIPVAVLSPPGSRSGRDLRFLCRCRERCPQGHPPGRRSSTCRWSLRAFCHRAPPEGFTAILTPNNDVQFEWTQPESGAHRIPVKDYLVYESATRRRGLSAQLGLHRVLSRSQSRLRRCADVSLFLGVSPCSGTALHLLRACKEHQGPGPGQLGMEIN